jgi:hypothetical protein
MASSDESVKTPFNGNDTVRESYAGGIHSVIMTKELMKVRANRRSLEIPKNPSSRFGTTLDPLTSLRSEFF